MSISLTQDFKTEAELSSQTRAILTQVRRTGRPVVVTREGKPEAVLLRPEEYEWLVHLVNLSRLLNEGEEDIRAGRVRPAEEVFKELLGGKKVSGRIQRKRRV